MLYDMIWSIWAEISVQQLRLLPSTPAVALSAPSALSNLQINILMCRRLALHLSMGREGVNPIPAEQGGHLGQNLGQGAQFCHHGQVQVTTSAVLFPIILTLNIPTSVRRTMAAPAVREWDVASSLGCIQPSLVPCFPGLSTK